MLIKQNIKTGSVVEINRYGKFIKVIKSAAPMRLYVYLKGEKVLETEARENFEFEQVAFDKIVVESETSQKVEFWVGQAKLSFNPLKSSVIGSAGTFSSSAPVFFGETVEILKDRELRAKLTLQADDDFFFGGEGITPQTAIEVKKGERIEINTQGAVYGFAKSEVYKKAIETQINDNSEFTQSTAEGVAGKSLEMICAAGGRVYVGTSDWLKSFNANDLSEPPLTISNGAVFGVYKWGDSIVYVTAVSYKLSLVIRDSKTGVITTQKELGATARTAKGFHVNGDKCVVVFDSVAQVYDLNDTAEPQKEINLTGFNVADSGAAALMNNGNVLVFGSDRKTVKLIDGSGVETDKTMPAEKYTDRNGVFDVSDSGVFTCAIFFGSEHVIKSYDNGISFSLERINTTQLIHSVKAVGSGMVYGLSDGTIRYQSEGTDVLLSAEGETSSFKGLAVDNGALFASVTGKIHKAIGDVVAVGGLHVKTFEEVN